MGKWEPAFSNFLIPRLSFSNNMGVEGLGVSNHQDHSPVLRNLVYVGIMYLSSYICVRKYVYMPTVHGCYGFPGLLYLLSSHGTYTRQSRLGVRRLSVIGVG
jgi:hypothetical protein